METKIKALVDDFDQFIGIDHHKKTTYLTIKDRQGEVVKKGNINTSKEELARFLNNGDGEEGIRPMPQAMRHGPEGRY